MVGVPQWSVLGLVLFAGIAITDQAVHYADDTQLHLATSVNNTAAGLSVLAACTADVRQWCLQNGLQLNPDKSEALVVALQISFVS